MLATVEDEEWCGRVWKGGEGVEWEIGCGRAVACMEWCKMGLERVEGRWKVWKRGRGLEGGKRAWEGGGEQGRACRGERLRCGRAMECVWWEGEGCVGGRWEVGEADGRFRMVWEGARM